MYKVQRSIQRLYHYIDRIHWSTQIMKLIIKVINQKLIITNYKLIVFLSHVLKSYKTVKRM